MLVSNLKLTGQVVGICRKENSKSRYFVKFHDVTTNKPDLWYEEDELVKLDSNVNNT